MLAGPDELPPMAPLSSPWSFKAKMGRMLWYLGGKAAFRLSLHNWYRYRRVILRCFGAKIGRRVMIRPSVHIEIPWTLRIDDDASVGDHAILYGLGIIRIGARATISQYAHLCAGTHDHTDTRFPLQRLPIQVEHDCWIGADVFVGPAVTIGHHTVVGARSSVFKSLPPGKICVGNPAKPIKDRTLKASPQ